MGNYYFHSETSDRCFNKRKENQNITRLSGYVVNAGIGKDTPWPHHVVVCEREECKWRLDVETGAHLMAMDCKDGL